MLRANLQLLGRTLILLLLLVIASSFIFYLPYNVVRNSTIKSLNNQQLILAKQAAQGIQAFFRHYDKMLDYLARHQHIITLNEEGKKLLEDLYRINKDEIDAVTRVNSQGIIIHTIPFNPDAIGKDISGQEHNRFIMTEHEPIVSDVFMAVQGYRTVAYAIPIFEDETYAGSLTILIPFDVISKKYVENILIGEDGYAWMINKNGVELYCPIPGHIGETVYHTSGEFPTVIKMAEEMMAGKQGITSYSYNQIKQKQTETIIKHAAYYPVTIPQNIWSIVIATPERHALAAISEFGKWWLALFAILITCVLIYVTFFVRSRLITEEVIRRKETEEKLKKSEHLFSQFINNAHIPIMMVNMNGTIELINKKCEDLYGYSRADTPTAESWFEKVYPDTALRKKLESRWQKEIEAAQTKNVKAISNLELPIRCNDGSVKEVFFDYTLVDERVLITLSDLTEQKSIEREKRRLHERESQARRMEAVGLMASSVAHDLNNILSGIVSYPDLLIAQLPAKSTMLPALNKMKEAGTRAATVVDDLLTAAKGIPVNKELYLIDTLVQEYCESPEHEQLFKFHPDVEFILQLGAGNSLISCSPIHIKKVLMNLVNNGAEAIKGKGWVSISTKVITIDTNTAISSDLTPGDYAVLDIKDSGTGISAEDLSYIFEPFYTKKNLGRSGSGLGLMIVWNCVQDHQGKIQVTSSENGTHFEILLPLSENTVTSHLQGTQHEVPKGEGKRILVVDDEPLLCEIASQTLKHEGYLVQVVNSGEEAITYLKTNLADLVILDMIMEPGINGRETYERIIQHNPNQKAIIVSGYSENEDIKKVIQYGSGQLLKKPYTRIQLLRAVNEGLMQHK